MENKMKLSRSGRHPRYGKAVVHAVLFLGCFITLAPFIWMFLTSMKTQVEAVSIPPSILPRSWRPDAYTSLPDKLPFFTMYWNTMMHRCISMISTKTLANTLMISATVPA